MRQREWGCIINVLLVSVKQPMQNIMLSNSVRMGVVGFAKPLAYEVAQYNITLNNVLPGSILTDLLLSLAPRPSAERQVVFVEAV
jgi:3-oxoacyl-[acyl-carrier protein] reductase